MDQNLKASDPPSPIEILRGANVGIVGGGNFCHEIIDFFQTQDLSPRKPKIIAVADINPDAKGLQLARQWGIFTTTRFSKLYKLDGLDVILEITHDANLAETIAKTIPDHIRLVDHFQARYLWDSLQIENIRHRILEDFNMNKGNPLTGEKLIQKSFDCFKDILIRHNTRSREIELESLENERTQSQIIQGSTIPTFVINKDHIVTHWNKALERLSGKPAKEVVGSNRQWAPFWQNERPTMADVILDQIDKREIEKLYGSQWRESQLIEDAYEAEVFFPNVGKTGKWLWFTAAPIKSPGGTIVGAIETLWDKTEDKKAEEDRARHTRELATLCSIYTALSAPWSIDLRIEAAIKEICLYLNADDVSLFLQAPSDSLYLKYHYGKDQNLSPKNHPASYKAFIRQLAIRGEIVLWEMLERNQQPELSFLAKQGFQSTAFIPISAKGKKAFGILQIASRHPKFISVERHALDMIGNRIGVTIENALLQEQNIKSEEKYRSLFNNDPNPIFIVDRDNFEILDINERARECYGYTSDELCGMSFLKLGNPDDREVEYGFRHLALEQSILLDKRRHFRKNGRTFYVNISVSHAQYGDSDVLIATTTDVTESIERETQLIQASKMTTLGLMAAGMAHEINQPLNVIQICADYFLKMLKKGKPVPEEDLRTMSNDIISNVARASGIIRHVRHFARQSDVVTSQVNINAPIGDVFKVLGHQIKVHQIELDLKLAPDIPYIMADHNRLEQVFINLVTNAIDAMDEKAEQPEYKKMAKRLHIETYTEGNTVSATVTDNGIGMSEEVKNKLFEPFFTTKKVGKGTGLGVSISYGIIKDYQGTINIDSKEGRGTTCLLTFPAQNGDA
jgi:PAS domain S-box-containing protein